jgi:8-oxo-dGTP pyrophosphatase MutT (NUDIX family)
MIWTAHVTVATVVAHEGRFLLVRECIDGRRVYNQPAGHLDDHETLFAAAIRETLEETAWEVEPEALVGIYQWRHAASGTTFIRFCFAAIPRRHYPDRPLDTDIEGAFWLSPEEIRALQPSLRSPLVWRCIEDYLAGQRHPLSAIRAL